jgi:hypothetical protein
VKSALMYEVADRLKSCDQCGGREFVCRDLVVVKKSSNTTWN